MHLMYTWYAGALATGFAGDANEAIELAEVDGPTLAKVTEFCKHYIASGKDYKELESVSERVHP